MLILSRKKGEAIQVGGGIEIKIVSINGDQVKIGVEAPNNVEIYRQEIYQQILEENQKAATSPANVLDLIKKSHNK